VPERLEPLAGNSKLPAERIQFPFPY